MRASKAEVVADLASSELSNSGLGLGSELPWGSLSQSPARDSATATTDDREDLVRRLSRLPEQERKIVVLRCYADQSEASVAEALGISLGTVKSAASRGLVALRQHAEADALAAQTAIRAQAQAHDTAAPLPASHTATTGIVRAPAGDSGGQLEVQFDRDVRVASNVKYFVVTPDGRRHEVGSSSTHKPGQKPDATWRSGVVGDYPFTIGLFPSPTLSAHHHVCRWRLVRRQVRGDSRRGPAHRNGDVVLRPGGGGRIAVFGQVHVRQGDGSIFGYDLNAATTDASGVAVVTERQTILQKVKDSVVPIGPPIAAGILPLGVSGIGWILTKSAAASPPS